MHCQSSLSLTPLLNAAVTGKVKSIKNHMSGNVTNQEFDACRREFCFQSQILLGFSDQRSTVVLSIPLPSTSADTADTISPVSSIRGIVSACRRLGLLLALRFTGKDVTVGHKIQIDVVSPEENVHVAVPLSTINDVAHQLPDSSPTAPATTHQTAPASINRLTNPNR